MTKTCVETTERGQYTIGGSEFLEFNELRSKNLKSSRVVLTGPSFSPPPLVPAQDVFGFYFGATYSPSNDRIYFAPGVAYWNFPGNTSWEYLDCSTGKLVKYVGSFDDVAYSGGAYEPIKDRIYFAPTGFGLTGKNLTCLDCKTGKTVYYQTVPGNMVDFAYAGAAYSPTQNRIYFVPHAQSDQANWHYVDCATGLIVSYANGLSPSIVPYAYTGAVYSPNQNRIYFIPADIAPQSTWHYLDCATGNVVAYGADSMASWINFLPAGLLANHVQSLCVYNSVLYVNLWTATNSVFQSWNGTSWSGAVDPAWPSGRYATAQIVYNGFLYTMAYDGVSASVWTFDGASWVNVTPAWTSDNASVKAQVVHLGNLYVGTHDSTTGAQLWENTLGSWSQITVPWSSSTTEIQGMVSLGGILYLSILTSGQAHVYSYNGLSFSEITPWAPYSSNTTAMYSHLNSLYVCLSGAPGIAIWKYDQVSWILENTSNISAWNVSGAMVVSESTFRNNPYLSVYSPLDGTKLWRGGQLSYEKVVSFSYNYTASLAIQDLSLGDYFLTGKDIAGASQLMKNLPQTTYPYGTSYVGGVYSPNQDRIYLSPDEAVADPSWQYIDCYTGNVLTYEHGLTSPTPCALGAYSPVDNRIYFGRFVEQAVPAAVNYVDCSTGIFGTLADSQLSSSNLAVIYAGSSNTTFFIPFLVPSEPIITVKLLSSDVLSPVTMSNPAYSIG